MIVTKKLEVRKFRVFGSMFSGRMHKGVWHTPSPQSGKAVEKLETQSANHAKSIKLLGHSLYFG